jgi:hypothetical protein
MSTNPKSMGTHDAMMLYLIYGGILNTLLESILSCYGYELGGIGCYRYGEKLRRR